MNRLCLVFLVVSCLISAFFCGKAVWAMKEYFSLDSQANAQIESWKIVEKPDSTFAICATYRFFIPEKEVEGKTEFAKPYFLNPYAAQKAIDQLVPQRWVCFFNAKHPEKNSLQRLFPFKACIQGILTLALAVYFFILRRWWYKKYVV